MAVDYQDFATDPEALNVDFWQTQLGRDTMSVVTAIERGVLPEAGQRAVNDVVRGQGGLNKLQNLDNFNASDQAIQLANMLNTSIRHYMPGGFIDDSKASPSDIKNLLTTASSVIKLITQVQGDLYTADRMSAMERAIFKTFDTITEAMPNMTAEMVRELKKHFRVNLERAFSEL